MLLSDALQAAHARGVEMRPDDPARLYDFDMVDVGDLSIMVIDETHPISYAPSRKYNGGAYEQWLVEQEAIRRDIWEAFDAGLRGKPLTKQAAMHLSAVSVD